MTQEEILDYNKRCAEFLGFKIDYYKETNEYGINGKTRSSSTINQSIFNLV